MLSVYQRVSVGKLTFFILLCVQVSWADPPRGRPIKGPLLSRPSRSSREKMITERFKALPKAQVLRSKAMAAKQLQSNLVPVFRALAENDDRRMPANVKASARSVSNALQKGQLTQPLINSLPSIMINTNPSKGNPALQLDSVIRALTPFSPQGNQSPLDGLGKFIRTNLNGVNNLLRRVLGGVPDLLNGVVPALLSPLEAVTDTVGGTVDSLGTLLGSLLAG